MNRKLFSLLFKVPGEAISTGTAPHDRFFCRRSLLRYFTALLWDSAAFPLAQIFMSLAEKRLVNAVEFENPSYMKEVVFYCVLVFLLTFFLNSIAEYQKEQQTALFMARLKRRFAEKLMLLTPEDREGFKNGDLIARMNQDMDSIGELYSWSLHRFFLGVFYGGGSILLMLLLCWQLAFIILILAVLEILCLGRLSGRIRELGEKIQADRAKGTGLFLSLLNCLKSVRMLSLRSVMYQKYSGIHREIARSRAKQEDRIALMNAVSELTGSVNLLGALATGCVLYFYGIVDLGTVMAFLTVQDGISYMFSNLKDFFSSLNRYAVSLERIYDILDLPAPERIPQEEGCSRRSFPQTISRIECRHLNFRFGPDTEPVLRDVSFTAESGDIVAITGPSGAGKSTLGRLLAGLRSPTGGEILYDGLAASLLSREAVSRFTAYVPQFPYLFHMSIRENILGGAVPIEQTTTDILRAARLADAASFIESREDGYSSILLENGRNLSHGQKQRIALARAFLSDKSVLILDESTSALDEVSKDRILDTLRREAKKGKIIFLISHKERLNASCSFILRLDENGRLFRLP